jgi:hypothetical protein
MNRKRSLYILLCSGYALSAFAAYAFFMDGSRKHGHPHARDGSSLWVWA